MARPAGSAFVKIYTRTGDGGQTGLIGGSRVSKSELRIEAIGAVDEANAVFGAIAGAPDEIMHRLPWIQSRLFDTGAELASPPGASRAYATLGSAHIAALETWIDEMDGALPELSSFILPGGSAPAAALHLARVAVRRAERRVVALAKSGNEAVRPDLLGFLNRLSDWSFTAARYTNLVLGTGEVPWTGEGNA